MIPTSIPDENVTPGARRQVIAAPNGDLTDDRIAPVEALVSVDPYDGVRRVMMRLQLEDGELQRLKAGKPVWLTMLGGVAPFDVQVER